MQSVTAQLKISGEKLAEKLSFTHLTELIKIDDDLKRTFYEIECIKGCWSVRELKRQVGSLYYERSGLSENKKKLAEMVQSGAEAAEPKLAIRDPYIFEFRRYFYLYSSSPSRWKRKGTTPTSPVPWSPRSKT